ncbi:MAG: hypothetical protein ACTIJJ_06890 [Galactobacter sp.]
MSNQTPRTVKRTGLVLPPRRKLGLGGATLRVSFYVLLSLVAVLCALALITDRLSLDKGHTANSVSVSTSTSSVNAEALTKRLEDLRLHHRDVDIWVIAQEGQIISNVGDTVISKAKKEKPDWLADEHLAPHKLVVFLNITDVNGHADSGLFAGMDLNDGHVDENRQVGNQDFAHAEWMDGLVRIVDAQVGKHPLGPLITGILWAVGVASLLAIFVIAVLARRRYAAAQEEISAGKDAIAALDALIPQVSELIDEVGRDGPKAGDQASRARPRAGAEHRPSDMVGPRVTAHRLHCALEDVRPACAYWSEQLDGFTRSRLRSSGAVAQVGYATTNLRGLVDRVNGLADVARMAGGLDGWQESAQRQAELLERDADVGARVLDAPAVQATDRTEAVLAAVDEAKRASAEVLAALGDGSGAQADGEPDRLATQPSGHLEVLALLEQASARLASEVAAAGNAAAANARHAEDVVPLLNASASASSAEADTPTVGRFTTVDAHLDPEQPTYPAALGFTEESTRRDLPTQGQRHPAAGDDALPKAEPISEQTGELLNPYVVVPGASAFYLAVKEAGGLPKSKAEEHEDVLDTEGVPKVQPTAAKTSEQAPATDTDREGPDSPTAPGEPLIHD